MKPLSKAARDARKPPPPAELMDARHEQVHRETGKMRPARAVRVSQTRGAK